MRLKHLIDDNSSKNPSAQEADPVTTNDSTNTEVSTTTEGSKITEDSTITEISTTIETSTTMEASKITETSTENTKTSNLESQKIRELRNYIRDHNLQELVRDRIGKSVSRCTKPELIQALSS